jgi:hypothetical protein
MADEEKRQPKAVEKLIIDAQARLDRKPKATLALVFRRRKPKDK